jgi:hypothetical protein
MLYLDYHTLVPNVTGFFGVFVQELFPKLSGRRLRERREFISLYRVNMRKCVTE